MTAPALKQPVTVLLESFSNGKDSRSFRFDGLKAVVTARSLAEVVPALHAVERAVEQGMHAAGFIAYEAAPALNPDLAAHAPSAAPLVWFGIFSERHPCRPGQVHTEQGECRISNPETLIDQAHHAGATDTIREAIARGETYQVNFTTRQRFSFSGDPFALYRKMCRNQQAPFCAWIDTGTHRILSAAPELFFSLDDRCLTMRPMKGTAPCMPLPDADRAQRERLAASVKERAENLMIVDLVRNDLSTIAETGSVAVPALFEVESYPTVHQMTSTVTARLRPDVGLTGIFRALFPCGSVTGAPKRRTMEIIRGLEGAPRGVYCGAIGYVSPGPEAVFSVAIRTAVLDMDAGKGEIGIGSGITWDSESQSEYDECLAKSVFLYREPPDFSLIESLRHDRGGYLLLERHLQRLTASAAWFGFGFDADALRARLMELGRGLRGLHKVRVLLAADGSVSLESHPLLPPPLQGEGRGGDGVDASTIALLALAEERVDPSDPFLYHKTTRRQRYDRGRRLHPECCDVLFLNERGEVTEGSFNNIVVSLGGELLTPAVGCGLLPGVLREELIEVGAIREAVLTPEDLRAAERIWLINSVRGWRECRMRDS